MAFAVGMLVSGGASADTETDCYLAAMTDAADDVTMGEIRARCAASAPALQTELLAAESPAALTKKKALPDEASASFTQQIAAERQSLDRSYNLTPHQPNYLLGYSLRNRPSVPEDQGTEDELDKEEVVLQVSVKFPVWRRMFRSENDILFAYTGKSWFQAYNSALSAPFRETNYEPEIFWRHYGGFKLPLGVRIAGWDMGYNHESNGRSEPLSRSWDRLMSRLAVDITPNLSMILRAWYRIPEKADSDDNPDIDDYMGYGDLRAIWTPNRNTFTAMFRPG
ncbi:MAG TPA: phospholipase A, partial [Pseudomonadales bacterium]